MIISFSLQNWMSFRDKVAISAVAGKQHTHRERVPKIEKYNKRILPILAIYGGNASGKSNIYKAFLFAKHFIIKGTEPNEKIDVEPFLLSPDCLKEPSRFCFELLINEMVYEFSFAATKEMVTDERLVEIKPTTERVLYERKQGKIWIGNAQKNKHLRYIRESTRKNQLFLTTTVEQNNNVYLEIYDWFRYKLKLISPEAKFENLEDILEKEGPFYDETNKILNELDTGILRLDAEDVEDKGQEMMSTETTDLMEKITGDRYIRYSSKDKLLLKKLVTYHKDNNGKEARFEFNQESDGTMRLIELLPAFLMPMLGDKYKIEGIYPVYIVDELDRSLHHLLIRNLLEKYLDVCNEGTRYQFIFTTHDLLIMDQSLLRRDEICIVERDSLGVSSIIPLDEYKGVRKDKNLLKSYIQGRFGGIPRL